MKQILTVLILFSLSQIIKAQSTEQQIINNSTNSSQADTTQKVSVGAYLLDSSTFSTVPNINRQFRDFYKLVPYYSEGSFLGYNPLYNRYTLNGLVINNSFGFDGVINGDQVNTQMISMQAIDRIQVLANPIDLSKSGFNGALIELTSKRGDNKTFASAFSYYSGASLTGNKVNGQSIDLANHSLFQGGFDLGGAIIKDKLFYYASFETESGEEPGSNFVALRGTERETNESRVQFDDISFVSAALISLYDYDPGRFEGFTRKRNSNKAFLRFDWELNPNHQLMLSYNYFSGEAERNAASDLLGHRGPDNGVLQFENSGYTANSEIHGAMLQWDARLSEGLTNKLQAGYSHTSDSRDPMSSPFPVINIRQNGINYIVAGHEPFSINNRIDQQVLQVNNEIAYQAGKHSLTAGLSFEKYTYDASLNFDAYEPNDLGYPGGTYGTGFTSMNDFFLFVSLGFFDPVVARARQEHIQRTVTNSWDRSENAFGQFAFYIQDDFSINPKLDLSMGIRVEKPTYFNTADKILEAINRKGGIIDPNQNLFEGSYAPQLNYFDNNGQTIQFDHSELPDTPLLISPRVALEYRAEDQSDLHLSLLSGIYNGRVPGSWLNNQVDQSEYYNYALLGADFRIPQVWRNHLEANLTVKRFQVRAGITYTQDINAPIVRNYGLAAPSSALAGVDSRLYYQPTDRAENPFGNPEQDAYVLESESKGRSVNFNLSVERQWTNDIYTMVVYNYLDAQNISSMSSPILSDALAANAVVDNTNAAVLSPSAFGNQHRVLAVVGKTFSYGKMSTGLSLLNDITRGGRYDYTYAGDANGDGINNNDLLYIPTADEIANYSFAGSVPLIDAQKVAFNNFINKDPYLSSRRGEYVERNGIRMPWQWGLDLRASQAISWNDQKLELTIDLINFHNLLNSEWRVRKLPVSTQPLGITVNPGIREPAYFFDLSQRSSYIDHIGIESRWQMRIGLNYTF
ncbi:TonB-dependent receptor [Roseivirga sp.]|uniref:TonB-dependent receptor n=1 Tax=Roseivirga sp. TaxID=1964215 RepID=UPI003B51C193